MDNKYCLLFKTGDAEIRSLDNLSSNKEYIYPIIELTRGRKSKYDKIGRIEKKIERISTIFMDSVVFLDLTSADDLSNEEIKNLYDPKNGYINWVNKLKEMKVNNLFKSIIPILLLDVEDKNLSKNLKLQYKNLTENFGNIAYRNSIVDDGCYEDIEILKEQINNTIDDFYFIIDCEYIAPGAWRSFANKALARINKISKLITNVKFIIVSTSFPKYVSDIGKDDKDTFRLNEIDLYNEVVKEISNMNVMYGDYGSINPIRNDQIVMANGWIPRIDVPTKKEIFYYRSRRELNEEYYEAYSRVANTLVMKDKRFPRKLNNNWGVNQINLSANNSAPGSSPSFWISVRMNIHIEQQIRRLKKLNYF